MQKPTASAQPLHDHIFLSAAHDQHARRTRWVVALTLIMMAAEIAAGYATGSMALLADGFHMATHAGALGIAAAAYAFAKRHARNARFSFGTGKVGDLAGFASALILAVVALAIAVESIGRLLQPTIVVFGEAIAVAILGLAVNLVSALLLAGGPHAHSHDHHAHEHARHNHHHDNNLRSAYLHVIADAFTSVLATAALLAGRYLGWLWLDPVIGLVGAVVIARWSYALMKETASVLLDTTDDHVVEEVRAAVQAAGDIQIRDLHVWRVGPAAHAAIVSVAATDAAGAHALREQLHGIDELAHITVEYWSSN